MKKIKIKDIREVLSYWSSFPGADTISDNSFNFFLRYLSVEKIKHGIEYTFIKPRENYFTYLCGILHNWIGEKKEGRK